MRIRLVGHSGEPCMNTGSDGPWREFVNELEKKGCEIVNSDFGAKIDAMIANTHSKLAIKECKENNIPKSKMSIILWEPKINDHKRHSPDSLANYGIIWSPSIDWGLESKTKYFNWPQIALEEKSETINSWSKRDNKAVMVLANKFSATKGELYSLRRKLVTLTSNTQTMDLFGAKWNLKRTYSYRHYFGKFIRTPVSYLSFSSFHNLGKFMKNYKGLSVDKIATTEKYRIVVVLENSIDYISEKLFDAFASNAIVIYVGPEINRYGIPEGAAIQINPNARLINRKIMEIQALPVSEQFKLMQSQQQKIRSVSKYWQGNTVLKKLASDIYKALQV